MILLHGALFAGFAVVVYRVGLLIVEDLAESFPAIVRALANAGRFDQ
jgi:hypothetical protein